MYECLHHLRRLLARQLIWMDASRQAPVCHPRLFCARRGKCAPFRDCHFCSLGIKHTTQVPLHRLVYASWSRRSGSRLARLVVALPSLPPCCPSLAPEGLPPCCLSVTVSIPTRPSPPIVICGALACALPRLPSRLSLSGVCRRTACSLARRCCGIISSPSSMLSMVSGRRTSTHICQALWTFRRRRACGRRSSGTLSSTSSRTSSSPCIRPRLASSSSGSMFKRLAACRTRGRSGGGGSEAAAARCPSFCLCPRVGGRHRLAWGRRRCSICLVVCFPPLNVCRTGRG